MHPQHQHRQQQQADSVCSFYSAPSNQTRKNVTTTTPTPLRKPTNTRPIRNTYNALMASVSRLRPSRSLRQTLQRATYIHFLLLPALLLLVIEMSPPVPHSVLPASAAAPTSTSSKAVNMSHPVSVSLNFNTLTTPVTSVLPSEGFPFPRQIIKGNSIVACCMNRHSTLKKTLPTWQKVANISEILIIDWSSEPPLRQTISEMSEQHDPRIRVVRVENESQWVLTRAYNLGISTSSYDTIIRTDCDYALSENFLNAHPLNDGGRTFYAGNYGSARDENEVHLNGAVYIKRNDFFGVGGYDERIQTYGWDDEELYKRLEGKGNMTKLNLSFDHVSHVPHSDGARAQHDVKFVQVEIDLNSLLLSQLGIWNSSSMLKPDQQWNVVASEDRYALISSKQKTLPLKELVSQRAHEEAWLLALARRLANDYAMPWDIMGTMNVNTRRLLLTRLNERMKHRPSNKPARMLFVHCMHGLGNRLRAIASAMSYAKSTDRELVVVWEKDAHIAAVFEDLFITDEIVTMSRFNPKWPFQGYEKWDRSWLEFKFYNYMEMEGNNAIKGQVIEEDDTKHLYFKSAYIMEVSNSSTTNWDLDNEMLRSLKPVPEVSKLVDEHTSKGLNAMIGVHIRDRTLDRDIKNVDFGSEYGKSASTEMEHWRQKSSYKNFVTEMKRLIAQDDDLKFYVATDTINVFKALQDELPGRIVFTDRDCDGRDGRCVRFALVDLLCLAKTKQLVGSNWSSFTEAASRFGGKSPRLSGLHFANDTSTNP